MAEVWGKNPLDYLPRWPGSIRQPLENPLQEDRLPDASGVELEYPSYRLTPAENRKHGRRLLLGFAFWSLVVALFGLTLQRFAIGFVFFAVIGTLAFYLFAVNDLERKKPPWRWLVYGLIVPLWCIAFLAFREPYPYLLLCVLASVRLSDLFASHFVHLKTTAPLPKGRSQVLRTLWRTRFRRILTAAKGLEFYILAALSIAAILFWVISPLFRPSRQLQMLDVFMTSYFLRAPRLLLGLLLLLVLTWLIERVTSFLFARPAVTLRSMIRAFREALTEWLTYNRHGGRGAGVFQSPSGGYAARRRMTLATVLLFVCLLAQLSSWERTLHVGVGEAFRDFSGASDPGPIEPLPWGQDVPTNPFGFEPRGPFPIDEGAFRPTEPSGIRLVAFRPEPRGDDGDLELEPWEEAYIRQLNPEERTAFLDLLRSQRGTPTPPAEEAASSHDEAPAAYVDDDWPRFYRYLSLAGMYVFVLGGSLCVLGLFPTLYVLTCCFATTARVAAFWSQEFPTESGTQLLNTETWDDLVTRIRASGDTIESDSLLLGVNALDDSPVIVPRTVFQEHAHLLGDSGSGKTSLGMASLITQFIRFGDSSVVVIDLKGDDLALMEGARIEAERAGIPFRWFSNELDHATYIFNPLTQSHLSKLTLYQRTDILTASLGLQYGTDYGRGFYSDANAEMLYRALKARPDGIDSFVELAAVLRLKAPFRDVPEDLRSAGSHLSAVLSRLADTKPLNATAKDGVPESALRSAIDMPDLFRTPQVLYFHLASAIGMASTAEIARLALYSLLTAAKAAQGPRTQVYLFVDEFQRIVSNNLELFLQQARSLNIGVILANQTIGDLKTADVDLIPTIRANTRFRQIFAASDLTEQDEIIKTSGETTVYSRTWSQYLGSVLGASGSTSLAETVTPRLRVNDVLLATDHPQQSIVQIRRGQGYAQFGGFPFVMTSAFHITKAEFERRKRSPWPERDGETIRPTLADAAPAADPGPAPDPRGEGLLLGPTEVIATPEPKALPPAPEPEPQPDPEPESTIIPAPEVEVATPPPPVTDDNDPFAALTRYQEERKRTRTRKKKGDSP